jgi:tetratricopeptide (TPR) repeat protein
MARACFVQEEYGQAAVILQDIVRQHDAGANYLRDLGYALYRLGRFQQADQVFGRMVRKKVLAGFAWYMRHFIALQEQRYADARTDMAIATRLEPGNAEYREALRRLESTPPLH